MREDDDDILHLVCRGDCSKLLLQQQRPWDSGAQNTRDAASQDGQGEGYEDPDEQDLNIQGSLKDLSKVKLRQMAPLAKSQRYLTEQLAQRRRPTWPQSMHTRGMRELYSTSSAFLVRSQI